MGGTYFLEITCKTTLTSGVGVVLTLPSNIQCDGSKQAERPPLIMMPWPWTIGLLLTRIRNSIRIRTLTAGSPSCASSGVKARLPPLCCPSVASAFSLGVSRCRPFRLAPRPPCPSPTARPSASWPPSSSTFFHLCRCCLRNHCGESLPHCFSLPSPA